MDVSGLLASTSKGRSTEVNKDVPLVVDTGLLAVFDPNDIEPEEYSADQEAYLLSVARDGVQALVNALFSLPVQKTADGPLAILPSIETPLPRAKPLPKPKPPTKWEQFAKARGIQKTKREKKVWDEEKQDWVDRWGRKGKNKEIEEQWITEVPANAPDDYDPVKEARDKRKSRVAKNEKQRAANQARAMGPSATAASTSTGLKDSNAWDALSKDDKKGMLRRDALRAKVSTASMGKFDKKLEGEPKLRGIKRKFDPNEGNVESEKSAALALLSKLERNPISSTASAKRPRKDAAGGEGSGENVLNVRKAVRYATKGKGATAFASRDRGRGGKAGRGKGKR
ncbi:hypothetical protein M408DRAFT_74023 [Serendipita vermifera MAFF 305830]|uniref:Ribosome biogenesis regulatory protein n=1 Tax=Serendipita vermifera MAFF 305830 TaxID=933852 RepID=A0A0C3AZU7_SERVB|nr:hypothetical protein M408DRAFT_74023 [Serendipita vermifera MAFF 305830]